MLLLILKNGKSIGFTSGKDSTSNKYYIDLSCPLHESFKTMKEDGRKYPMTGSEFKQALAVIGDRESPLFSKKELSAYFRDFIKLSQAGKNQTRE